MSVWTESRSPGKERDSETGLDYFGARYYGSTMGRFLATDPLKINSSRLNDPQGLNLYAYTRNRPTIAVDVEGLLTLLVVVDNRRAHVALFSDSQRLVSIYHGLARGAHGPSRRIEGGDTPFGKYLFTGMQGGNRQSRLGRAYGTGKISFTPDWGEVFDSGRSLIRIHGGGTRLGEHAYDADQELVPTAGCVRLHNQDVNSLIGDIHSLEDDEGEENVGDSVYIGSPEYLLFMAQQRDKTGNLENPDLYRLLAPFIDPHWFIPPGGCVPGGPGSEQPRRPENKK